MKYWKEVKITEPAQAVGVHPLQWRDPAPPEYAFVMCDEDDELHERLETAEALAKAVKEFAEWAETIKYNPHSPFGWRLLGLMTHVKNWEELKNA